MRVGIATAAVDSAMLRHPFTGRAEVSKGRPPISGSTKKNPGTQAGASNGAGYLSCIPTKMRAAMIAEPWEIALGLRQGDQPHAALDGVVVDFQAKHRAKLERVCDTRRPHSALGYRPPEEFEMLIAQQAA